MFSCFKFIISLIVTYFLVLLHVKMRHVKEPKITCHIFSSTMNSFEEILCLDDDLQ